jgi:hypothetical protein
MTEQIRLRIDRRGLPFHPSDFPALEEYGATLAQATAAEDLTFAEIKAARKAGKLKSFSGKTVRGQRK